MDSVIQRGNGISWQSDIKLPIYTAEFVEIGLTSKSIAKVECILYRLVLIVRVWLAYVLLTKASLKDSIDHHTNLPLGLLYATEQMNTLQFFAARTPSVIITRRSAE